MAVSSPPRLSVAAPPSRLGAAGTQAVKAAGGTIVVLAAVGSGYGAALGVMLSPVAATIGAVVGAVTAPDQQVVKAHTAALQKAVGEFDIQGALIAAVVASARPDRAVLTEAVVADTQLELEVAAIQLVNRQAFLSSEHDPVLQLVLRVQTRLVDVAGGRLLFERKFEHVGDWRAFTGWAADDGRALTEALAEACHAVGRQMVDELL